MEPHYTHKEIKDWEDAADRALKLNEQTMGADGLGVTSDALEELVWDGLEISVSEGFRSQFDADQIYFNWFKHRHGEVHGTNSDTAA